MFGHQIRAGQDAALRPKLSNLNIGPTRFNKQRSTVVGDMARGALREDIDEEPQFSTLEEEGMYKCREYCVLFCTHRPISVMY
jgi:hypothetical protein